MAENVKMLVTLRERLDLQSEYIFDLHGLKVEAEHKNLDEPSEALQLFSEHARHAKLEFEIKNNFPEVTRICKLVGGMPLAIDLAASWIRLLSPAEILFELEDQS